MNPVSILHANQAVGDFTDQIAVIESLMTAGAAFDTPQRTNDLDFVRVFLNENAVLNPGIQAIERFLFQAVQ